MLHKIHRSPKDICELIFGQDKVPQLAYVAYVGTPILTDVRMIFKQE